MNALDFVVWAEEQKEFDPSQVTPGVVGFLITFLVGVGAVLLIIDMVRRVRRVNYRQQARDKIAAEHDVQDGEGPADQDGSPQR